MGRAGICGRARVASVVDLRMDGRRARRPTRLRSISRCGRGVGRWQTAGTAARGFRSASPDRMTPRHKSGLPAGHRRQARRRSPRRRKRTGDGGRLRPGPVVPGRERPPQRRTRGTALEVQAFDLDACASELFGEGLALSRRGSRPAVITRVGGKPANAEAGNREKIKRGSARSLSAAMVWLKNPFMKPE